MTLLAGAAVDLLLEFCKLAGDVSCVAVNDRRVACADLTWMIQDDHLSGDVLEGQAQGFVGGTRWGHDGIQRLQQANPTGMLLFSVQLPALEPGHLKARLHVVPMPPRDGHKGYTGWVVANLLDVGADLLHDLIITLFTVGWFGGIHLVDCNNELLDAQCVSQQRMFSGLPIFGDSRLKLTHPGSHNEHCTICLQYLVVSNFQREMSMVMPRSRSAFSLSRTQAYLNEPLPICFLLKLLNGPLINAPALVDQVSRGGGLARVHMAYDHDVDVNLLLPHGLVLGTDR
ncbi:hypothetical protein Z043_100823, partial [Scleropages formosus]